jgi:hypothetical protein
VEAGRLYPARNANDGLDFRDEGVPPPQKSPDTDMVG